MVWPLDGATLKLLASRRCSGGVGECGASYELFRARPVAVIDADDGADDDGPALPGCWPLLLAPEADAALDAEPAVAATVCDIIEWRTDRFGGIPAAEVAANGR